MGISPIELSGGIQRVQDFAQIKQQEDNRPLVNQMNSETTVDRHVDERINTVEKKDDAESYQHGFDSKEKGSNEYYGDGGRGRKKKDSDGGHVVKKGIGSGFDVRI